MKKIIILIAIIGMIFATSSADAQSSISVDTTTHVSFYRAIVGEYPIWMTYPQLKSGDTLKGCNSSFVRVEYINFKKCFTFFSWTKVGDTTVHHNDVIGFVSNGIYVMRTESPGSVVYDTLVVQLNNNAPIKPKVLDIAGFGGMHCGTKFEFTIDSIKNFSRFWWVGQGVNYSYMDTINFSLSYQQGLISDERKIEVTTIDTNGCLSTSDVIVAHHYDATTPTTQFNDKKLFTGLTGTFNWYIDSNIVATNNNNFIFPKVTGNYQVQFIDWRGCKSFLSKNWYIVVPKVISSDTIVLNADSNSVQIPFFKSYNDYKAVVCWKVTKNGVLIQDKCVRINEVSYIDVTEGVYFINSTSSFGIESTDTIVVLKRKATGLNDISKLIEVSTYPNPFTDSFTISNQSGSKIVIFNLTGKSMFETLLQSNEEIIKPEIPSGLYLLKIYNNDQYIGYKKILKD